MIDWRKNWSLAEIIDWLTNELNVWCVDKNNLELDVDIAGDLAALKDNLAKFKKGKMKGLEDIDINELDWVRDSVTWRQFPVCFPI